MEKSVKTFGNSYFQDSFFNEKVKPADVVYSKNYLQIGRVVKSGRVTDEVYTLNIKENGHSLLLGSTRSGKSFLLRTIADRFSKLGNSVIYLNDVKDECSSSKYPVQEEFQHLLLPGETPQGFKMLPLRPTFFRQIDTKLAKDNHWYSPDSRALTRADFMTLMNASKLPINQQTAMEVIFQGLQSRLAEDDDLKITVDLLYDVIDSDDDIAPATKKSLKFKFKPLETSSFFVPEEEKNIITAIKKGYIPNIVVENFDSFGEGSSFQFTEVLLGMVFREIRIARRAKKIPRLLCIFDEASRFAGNSRETSIKQELLSSHDLDARYGIMNYSAWQSVTDIPVRILQQARYVFIPNTLDTKSIQSLLVLYNLTKNVQTSVRDAMRIKQQLKAVPFAWVVIDKMLQTITVMTPLAPLSNHSQSKT